MTVTPRPGHQQALSIKLLTLQQAYWASRPPTVKSPVGNSLKLFRPDEKFMLGAPRRQPGRRANEAERSVALQRPFYLATHETTNAQYRRWKDQHSSAAIRGQTLDMNDQPVAKVSWQDAALFCNWLSRNEGLPPFYTLEQGRVVGFNWDAHGYRLPTEAEWAWAAKIDLQSNSSIFPWSNDLYPPVEISGNYADQSARALIGFTLANYNDKYPVSAVVGSFRANSKGLFDMSGNVAEWVNDYFDIRPRRGEPELDPRGPQQGSKHVIRGSSWASPRELNCATAIETPAMMAESIWASGLPAMWTNPGAISNGLQKKIMASAVSWLAVFLLAVTPSLSAQEADPQNSAVKKSEQSLPENLKANNQPESEEQPQPEDFKPSEEISEDFPVPLPSDI